MPKREMCTLEHETRGLKGFLGGHQGLMTKVVAVVYTLEGKKVIHETNEFRNSQEERKKLDNERAKLIAGLLAEGWEPISADERGKATTFRRQVSN